MQRVQNELLLKREVNNEKINVKRLFISRWGGNPMMNTRRIFLYLLNNEKCEYL